MSKTILTNFTNLDKFVQFIKIWADSNFWKNLRKFQKTIHILVHIYFDILMHNCVQRSFTSTACPDIHTIFFLFFHDLFLVFSRFLFGFFTICFWSFHDLFPFLMIFFLLFNDFFCYLMIFFLLFNDFFLLFDDIFFVI